jgi:lysozyme
MREAGLVRGAWHTFRPGAHAAQQAVLFLKSVDLQRGDLPPVLEISELDLSRQSFEAIRTWTSVVASELEARHGRAMPAILRLRARATPWRQDLRELASDPLWIIDHANYDQPSIPEAWGGGQWLLHQYARGVRGLPGVSEHANLTKFNVVKLADRGRRVSHVKQCMRDIGFGFGVSESNELDRATREAVVHFQVMRGLVQDGLVGPKTYAELQWQS